jgi:heme/copper-type cytochrome/quinol oxidase subunit 3
MSDKNLQPIRPLFILFVMMSAFFITGKKWLLTKGIEPEVVIIGNLILFLVSLTAFFVTKKSLNNNNSHAFVRGMYGSFVLKFFALAIAAFIYIYIAKDGINKPGLLLCGLLYFLYTAIETRALMKMLKQNKNA